MAISFFLKVLLSTLKWGKQGISRERVHLGHHSEGESGRNKTGARAGGGYNERSRRAGEIRGTRTGYRDSLSAGQAARPMPHGGDRTGLSCP